MVKKNVYTDIEVNPFKCMEEKNYRQNKNI